MTEPTYRIEIRHDPHSQEFPYDAYIYRLLDPDELHVHRAHGKTQNDALSEAQRWIAEENSRRSIRSVYVTEDGELCNAPEPQSLRA